MSKETFAIINDKDQVVNHILVDKDAPDFEAVMTAQLAHWGCVRYVETTNEEHLIILDPSPEVWTTHTEETGFVIPEAYLVPAPSVDEVTIAAEPDHETVKIKGRTYPADSLLIAENAALRPAGWVIPDGQTEVSLADADK